MIPINAALVEIATPGALDRSGDPGPPVVAWQGRASGFLTQRNRQVISGGTQVRQRVTVLIVPAPFVATIAGADWEASSVVIEDRRAAAPVKRRYTVSGLEIRAAGTPADTLRLELDSERAP